MELSAELLQKYVGGELELQNERFGHCYRGQIKTMEIRKGRLWVTFNWIAKAVDYPPFPTKWAIDKWEDYHPLLSSFSATNIGPSGPEIGGSDRLFLEFPVLGDKVVLFPPDGSKLDPSRIQGCVL